MNATRPLILAGCFLAAVLAGAAARAQQCTAPAAWFPHDQTPPPDPTQAPMTNCAFHQWAWQEFLWLTQATDGGALRFTQFATPADLFAVGKAPPALKALPKRPRLKLTPRSSKSSGPTSLGEISQAGTQGVLVAQDGRVVYYATFVNDVYYNFVQSNGYNNPQTLLNAPADQTFPVGSLELKSSWRVVPQGEQAAGYYTTTADIELLVNQNGTVVVDPSQTQAATVALVGLHVVGVVQDHPEFIWASFENKANAPDLPSGLSPSSPNPVSATGSTFYAANTAANQCNLGNGGQVTLDQATQQLSPITNVFRQFAQGGGPADNQANIQSLNASVQGQLGNDVFANYQLVGGLWMLPNTLQPNQFPPPQDQAGSTSLANATMETFAQGINCFGCHNTLSQSENSVTLPGKNLNLSHILVNAFFQGSEAAKARAKAPKK